MTSTQGRSFVTAGKVLTTRIAVSAVIAGAAIIGVGVGTSSATGCGQFGVGNGYCTGGLVTPKVHGPAANAQHTAAQAGRGTANNVVGGVKTGCFSGYCG